MNDKGLWVGSPHVPKQLKEVGKEQLTRTKLIPWKDPEALSGVVRFLQNHLHDLPIHV